MKRANIIILLLISAIAFGCGQVIKHNAIDSGPTISYITPTTGDRNTVITVAGRGFGDERGNSNVYYANQKLTPESWSNTLIHVRLYDITLSNNPSGRFRVEVNGTLSNESPQTFNSGDLSGIAGITPSEGTQGTIITITLDTPLSVHPEYATFFELNSPSNQAKSNLHKQSSNSYYCYVPDLSNLSGTTTVGVQMGPYKASGNTMFFKYIAPGAGNLSQSSGTIGDSIIIYGSGFGNNQNAYNSSLYMSGSYIPPVTWSDQAITFKVPNISPAGSKTLTLRASGKDMVLGNFDLRAPMISTNPDPNKAVSKGDTIVLTGNYFSTLDALKQVGAAAQLNFDRAGQATVHSWSNTHISFEWPFNHDLIGTKRIKLHIKVGHLQSNEITFTAN
jgi:hypothetical protein